MGEADKMKNPTFRICLYQPEMPANTGNIGRLCVGSNAELHIIKPMRFLITDKLVKRAGLIIGVNWILLCMIHLKIL